MGFIQTNELCSSVRSLEQGYILFCVLLLIVVPASLFMLLLLLLLILLFIVAIVVVAVIILNCRYSYYIVYYLSDWQTIIIITITTRRSTATSHWLYTTLPHTTTRREPQKGQITLDRHSAYTALQPLWPPLLAINTARSANHADAIVTWENDNDAKTAVHSSRPHRIQSASHEQHNTIAERD